MECPLCEHTGLDANVEFCPSCNADLSAYHALDTVEEKNKKQKRTLLLFIILFIIALLACIAIFFIKGPVSTPEADDDKLAQYEATIDGMKAENHQLGTRIATLETELKQCKEEAKTKPAVTEIKHVLKEGETLFDLAEKYYGDGELYTRIAADNNIDDPNIIYAGTVLIIKM